jgi:hypothetical protein
VCLDASQFPSGPVVLPGALNTDALPCLTVQPTNWKAAGQPDACFVVGTTITSSGGATTVTGTRPLVLLATDSISLDKDLAASSRRGQSDGPGANYAMCAPYGTPPGANDNGGGGGAGASFMTQGGSGGTGNNTAASAGAALAADTASPTILRGGCKGQPGGDGPAPGSGGGGASGGGAIYLVAGTSITLAGNIHVHASGAGSAKGGHAAGGGGGGSGGMILLSAPTISATGTKLSANGGGGSSGGDGNAGGHNGNDGNDPDPNQVTTAAGGGNGPGGDGGDGYALGSSARPGVLGDNDNAGGGGGGGGGYIQASMSISATTSPLVTIAP